MASFDSHILQAKKNLAFLQQISKYDNYEWQVTVCFYVAVHLVNAHLAKTANLHYRSHGQVDQSINPYNDLSPCKLPTTAYTSYQKLHNLSRRARYLIHDDPENTGNMENLTYSIHLAKAVKNLEIVLNFMKDKHDSVFDAISIKCIDLTKNFHSEYFTIV